MIAENTSNYRDMTDLNDNSAKVMKVLDRYKNKRKYFTWKEAGGLQSWWDLDVC